MPNLDHLLAPTLSGTKETFLKGAKGPRPGSDQTCPATGVIAT